MPTAPHSDPKAKQEDTIRQGRVTGIWRILLVSTVLAAIALAAVWAFYA